MGERPVTRTSTKLWKTFAFVTCFSSLAVLLSPSIVSAGSSFIEWESGTSGSGGGINATVDATISKGSLTTFEGPATNPTFIELFAANYGGMSHFSGPGSTLSNIISTVSFSSTLPVGARLVVVDVDVAGENITLSSSGTPLTLLAQLETLTGQSSAFPSWDPLLGQLSATTPSGQFNNTEASVFNISGLSSIQVDSFGGKNNSGIGVAVALPTGAINITTIGDDLPLIGSSVLQVEIAGLVSDPNAPEHDQYIVTGSPGTATLAGRLDVPLFDLGGGVFDPDPNDEVTFLTATSVSGRFDALSSPNLVDVDPALALKVVQSATDVKVRFVESDDTNQFDGTALSSNWAETSNWTAATVPESVNVITVDNEGGADQRVEVMADPNLPDSDNAFVHSLVVEGATNKMTVSIQTGSNLSAVTGLVVAQKGVVELDGGAVVTSELEVQGEGLLTGNGTVVGNLALGDGAGTMAILSPGFTVGHVDVQGNYRQQSNGELMIDVEDPNNYDTVAITGEAELGGTLEVMLDDEADAPVGTVIEVLSANSFTGTFDDVLTTGVDDIYLAPVYDPNAGIVALASYAEGDMDPFTPGIGEEDAVAFALALTDPVAYRNMYGISADEAGDIDDIGNNGLDFDDIDDFVRLLNQHIGDSMTMARMFEIIAEIQAVPEPNTLALGLLACCVHSSRRQRPPNLSRLKGIS